MKRLCFFLCFAIAGISADAAEVGRASMAAQYAPGRAVASKNQISGVIRAADTATTTASTTASVTSNTKDVEKMTCINNNIGVGNTFVWASRYSNPWAYSSLIEDTENPDNNLCFVRVELKSADSKISISDIEPAYYPMGTSITCGSWVRVDLERRILDAKKSARTWGTIAGAVGGAGIGVGAMELFGNKLIGGAVEGQRALSEEELLRAQILTLKQNNDPQYAQFKAALAQLKADCETKVDASGNAVATGGTDLWAAGGEAKPEECTKYESLIRNLNAI